MMLMYFFPVHEWFSADRAFPFLLRRYHALEAGELLAGVFSGAFVPVFFQFGVIPCGEAFDQDMSLDGYCRQFDHPTFLAYPKDILVIASWIMFAIILPH
jgi:hypothetical protein